MEIKETKLYINAKGGVSVYRKLMVGEWMHERRSEIISDGKAVAKPGTGPAMGVDMWPDWDKLVTKARKKLAAAQKGEHFEKKKKALAQFLKLDRLGLIDHDWGRAAETGLVEVRSKLETMEPASESIN